MSNMVVRASRRVCDDLREVPVRRLEDQPTPQRREVPALEGRGLRLCLAAPRGPPCSRYPSSSPAPPNARLLAEGSSPRCCFPCAGMAAQSDRRRPIAGRQDRLHRLKESPQVLVEICGLEVRFPLLSVEHVGHAKDRCGLDAQNRQNEPLWNGCRRRRDCKLVM